MKKLLLIALVACAGCAAASSSEQTGKQHQAIEGATGDTKEKAGHGLPPIRPGVYAAGKDAPNQHGGFAGSGSWKTLANTPSTLAAGFSILLTDGSVMVQDLSTMGNTWWKLSPDASGGYANGTWKQLAPMPGDYAPLYFASAVLPDGRVIVMGGEYQAFQAAWQARGAIYDPTTDQWTSVAPPTGWDNIGDAQSVVLPDGRFLLANPFDTRLAILDPSTLTWIDVQAAAPKADIFDEEGFTLLWNGSVLTVDANNTADLTHSELFFPGSKKKPATWSNAGSTIVQLADLQADGSGSHELGSAMLRPDGTVFVAGATGHTAIYDSLHATWTAGPDMPVAAEGQLGQADGPSALLPNGNVLLAVSPGIFQGPVHYVEFDGTALHEVAAPASAQADSSFNVNLLLLPTGEVLSTDFSGDVEIYTPTGAPRRRWAPELEGSCGLHVLQAGQSATIHGERLHGLSSAVAYGDDAQAATNYPLVRITNRATGHVAFARTHGFDNFRIGPHAEGSATFDVPSGIELGESDLVVIANGIASDPVRTTIIE